MGRPKPTTSAQSPRGTGRRFFLWWVLAFLGFPLGGLLAITAAGPVEGVLTAALAGVLAGAVIGSAQWLALREPLKMGSMWIAATALGLGVGNTAGAALTGAGTQIGDLLVTGLAAGAAVGLSQWALLRKRTPGAALWPAVVTVAWPVGWTVTWAVGVDVERGYAVFGASGALVFAAVTGAAMLLITRR
jgi:hypothetical protein